MRLFGTGDTHGWVPDTHKLTFGNWKEGKNLKEEDLLIIAGDFGWLWTPGDKTEEWWLDWMQDRPYSIAFIDGNHENFDMLNALDIEERWGAPVGIVRPNIVHLKRGNVYQMGNKKIFVFGGGKSMDKEDRLAREKKHKKPRSCWWPEEYPSTEELDLAWKNIMLHKKVDYVFSHVPPEHILDYYLNITHHSKADNDFVSLHLRDMSQVLQFEYWYHGHMHVDTQVHPKYIALYHKIIELGKNLDPKFDFPLKDK